jgi:hypothetical protein
MTSLDDAIEATERVSDAALYVDAGPILATLQRDLRRVRRCQRAHSVMLAVVVLLSLAPCTVAILSR